MNNIKPAMFTPQEAADYLGVPVSQIYTLHKNKDFPSIMIGKHLRIHIESLDKWCTKGLEE